ncbi:MAG: glycosyltransferase family 4 protein [Pseudomonadota bacterium]
MGDLKINGLISGGLMGAAPFDPASWSGSSAAFFGACRDLGALENAYGVDIPKWRFAALAAPRFARNKEVWRRRVYKSVAYRQALESALPAAMAGADPQLPVVQLGAYVNLRSAFKDSRPWVTYQDGNAAEYAKSPFTPAALKADQTLHQTCIGYETRLAEETDLVLTTSEWLRRSFIENYGLSEDKVTSIGCGMNAAVPDALPDKDYSAKDILFIGKEFDRKGGDVAVAALAEVRKKFPDAKLHIVGPADLPSDAKAAPGVIHHGFLNRSVPDQAAQLEKLFLAASIFVLPTRYEPFGIAPLEAMGWGVPAIVTGDWALAENISPGETGAHMKRDDAQGLADQVIDFLEHPEKLAKMGAAAHRTVTDGRYDWAQVAQRLLTVMEKKLP